MTGSVGGVERRGSGGPWEDLYGYARVVRADGFAFVSGCTATVDGAVVGVGDAATQARTAFGIALDALDDFGVRPSSVVRTRMYVTDAAHADAERDALQHFEVAERLVDVVQDDDRLARVLPGVAGTARESARTFGVPCGRHHWLTV